MSAPETVADALRQPAFTEYPMPRSNAERQKQETSSCITTAAGGHKCPGTFELWLAKLQTRPWLKMKTNAHSVEQDLKDKRSIDLTQVPIHAGDGMHPVTFKLTWPYRHLDSSTRALSVSL